MHFPAGRRIFNVIVLILFVLSLFSVPTAPVLAKPAEEPLEKPLAVTAPNIGLTLPAQAMIGQNVNFSVTFDNNDSVEGYGPFIEVYLDVTGTDGVYPGLDAADLYDGLGTSSISYTYAGQAIQSSDVWQLTLDENGEATHPILRDSTGNFVTISAPGSFVQGDKVIVIRLPFGSFVPSQPPVSIDFSVNMSNLADLNIPLNVAARGGYQFGGTPLDDWCCGDDPSTTLSGFNVQTIIPTLLTLTKENSAPEDETATGPNFPKNYTITVSAAPGQTINNLDITDVLPSNVQYVGPVTGATCATLPSTSTPGGTLGCAISSFTGSATISFPFYIPLRDSSNNLIIDSVDGDDETSCNNVAAVGDWNPIDTRDIGGTDNATGGTIGAPCEDSLADKSIAVQKGVFIVSDTGATGASPGDTLEYTINFQISDYFAFQGVYLEDVFSDGQHFDPSFAPVLSVAGNGFTTASTLINASNFDVSCNYTGAISDNVNCTELDPAADDGTTMMVFRVSDELITRTFDGKLIGGCLPLAGTGGADPDCNIDNDGGTTGTITFRTVIQENFTDTFPSGDASVDQGDVLDNDVDIYGDILDNSNLTDLTGEMEADNSSATLSIARGPFSKSIYALNGNTTLPDPVRITVGDEVTYRLRYTLVTSDVEDLQFTDYFPLPIFDVTDPNADGIVGPSWTFDTTVDATVPAPGEVKFGPLDTFYNYTVTAGNTITPVVSSSASGNSVTVLYGDFDYTDNISTEIDLFFTVTVTDEPFADGLYLTNQASVSEGSTNASDQSADSIVQVVFTAPALYGDKAVVATNGDGTLNPSLLGPDGNPWADPGAVGAQWGGTINSSWLASNPIDSNLDDADAGDLVTFAITLENQGTGINGAFDIVIQDVLDSVHFGYPGGDPANLNLQVYYGDGTGPITFTDASDNPLSTAADIATAFFGTGIKLVDPVGEGVCSKHDPNLGNNVIVITYDLQLSTGAEAGATYTNTATLVNYAGQEGGTNFVPNGEDFTAEVNIDEPSISKSLVSTSIENTNNDRTHVVIGEIVTYELVITVPEGTTPNAQVVDTMSAGLAFVDINSVTYATNVTSTYTIGTGVTPAYVTVGDAGAGTGNRLTFNFGAITNTNVDNGTDNTITIEYDAVVLNVIGNQSTIQLGNNAVLSWTGGNTNDGGDLVTVIEPTLTTTKAASPSSGFDAGDTINYTITINNANGANDTDAYDLIITDVIPSGLTYTASTLTTTCTGSSVNAGSAPTLTVNVDQLNKNSSCTVSYAVTVDAGVTPNQTFINDVDLTWTSLPEDNATDLSDYNTNDDERDGENGVGTGLDNYAATTSRPVISEPYSVVKSLVATSEAHTSGTNVTIGEIVRYQLRVLVPEGDSPAMVVQDTLPIGLTFLNDDTAMYWFESDSPFTSDVTGLSLTGLNIASTASPGVDFDDTNISTSRDDITNGDFYNTGTDVNFRLGNLTNNDRDGNDEYIYIQFNVLVDNTVTGSNDAGETRGNSARAYKNENTAVGSNSNSVSVTIVEPQLNIEKSVSPASADAGDTITYTLDVTNGSTNASHAFELLITDAINTNLSINSVTITQNDTVNCPDGNPNAVTTAPYYSGQNVTVNVACLAPGDAMQIEVSANVIPTAPSGGDIPNTAYLTWTSLPGTGTSGNPTGTDTPGASGADDGERNGSGTGANDYADDSTASLGTSVGLNQATIDKSVTPTSYTIGDLITYRLLVTLAEGNTVDLVVDDNIPAGFDFEAYRVITTAAASSGLLSADYVGADPSSPTVTDDGGNGGDVEFDFGTQFTNADNDANNNSFVIELDVRVLDVFTSGNTNTNYDGLTKTNSVTLTHTNGSDSDSVDVTLVEPEITTTKTVALSSGYTVWQAGSVLDYTIRFENTGNSTAFDVTARDDLAQGVSYDTGSMACEILDDVDSSYGSLNVTVDDQTTYLLISGTDGNWHIPVDHKIDCTYTATVLNSVYVDGTHTNTVDADWSSLLLSPGEERTYDDSTAYPVDGTQDTDTAQFTVGEPTISKTVLPLTATIGDTVTFTVVITSPYGTLRDLEIVDTLPAGMRYVGPVTVVNGLAVGNPGVSGQTLTWTLGDTVINSGNATSTFTFQAVVENVIGNQAGGNLENSVDLNYTDAQDASQTLSDTADVDLVEPQMAVTKTNNASATIDAGDTVTYTLAVTNPSTNANNTTAYDLLITDQVYTGTSITVDSITPSGAITGVTDNTAGSDLLSITVDSFPVDAQLVIVYTITLPDTVVPNETIDNAVDLTWTSTASDSNTDERNGDDGVSGTLDDYAAEDDTSFDINTVGITKSITATTASHTLGTDLTIGEVATFEILVTFPDGTITAPLAIVDNLPIGFSVVSGTVTVDQSGLVSTLGTVTTNVDTTTELYEILQISYASDFVVSSADSTGNVLRITYDAVVNDVVDNSDGDSKSNNASVSWDSDGPVSATPVDMQILEPELQVDKNFTPNPVGLGQTATYTINLSHTAASSTNAMDITIIDVIPAGLTYVTGSIGYDSTNCPSSTITPNDSAAPSLSWTIDQLVENGGSDESCQLTYQVTVDDNSLGETLTNSVTGGYSTISGTPTPDEERDYTLNTDVDLVTTGPELSITKDDGVTETTPGSTLTYTLNYANNGNGGATGVVITETVPNNATFTTTGSTAGWSCTPDMNAGSTCTLAIGNLGVGAAGSATFVVVVNATVPANVTQIVNDVSIAGNETEPTPDPNSNSDTDTDTLTAAVDLTLTKIDDVADGDSVNPGDTIIYTLTYDNIGNRDATGVEIVDDVPANTTFTTTGSTAGWSCSPDSSAGSTCTFVIGDVDVNDPAGTVYFAVVVDDPLASGVTEILNAATIGGNETELVTTNNTDDETTPVIAEPNLTITKVADGTQIVTGGTIVYTITYDNNGDQTATGVVITETVPANTTFTTTGSDPRWSCTDGDVAGTECTVTIGTLTVGGGLSDPIAFAVVVNDTVPAGVENIYNLVEITDDGLNSEDGLPKTDNDDEETLLLAAPDLNIVKDDGVEIIQAGQNLTYTITYNNVGDQDATGVVITDTVPLFTTYNSEATPGWVCVPDETAGSSCTYTIGDLAAGATGQVSFAVDVDDPIDATIENIYNFVSINDDEANGSDPTPEDNSDEETTPLDALPDLTITKNDRDVTAVPGDSIQYGLAYENVGQQNATGVVITETVPDYTTYDAVNSNPAWVCDDITAGSTCTFAVGDLNAGDSGSVLFAVLVENPLTAGVESIVNDVSIEDDGTNGEDPTPENNVDNEETPVDAISDLTITKDDGVVQVTPGEELTYTIVVANVQNQTATGVVVTDTLPIGVVFVSASNDGVYDDTNREIVWNLGELAGGGEITLTVEISVEDPFTGVNPEIVNEVIVEDDGSNGVDPTPENNEDSDRDLIGDSAKVISDTNQTHTAGLDVAVGEVVTYAVTLDIAPGLVQDLVFTDILDQGMAFVGCNQITTDPADVLTLEPGYTLSGLCTMAAISQYPVTSTNIADGGRQMVINFGDVTNISAAEEDITLTIEYDVVILNTEANVDGQTLGNQATWTWIGGSLEAEASRVTIVEPDLVINKSVTPKTAYNNQTVTFTVTLNHTEESNSDAFNLVITDTLPEKLTYVPGSLVFVSGQVPTTINDLNAPVLRVGWDVFTQTTEPTVLTYQARITKANPGAKIENTVTMEWTSLPGDVLSPQSPYNQTSVERSYAPGSNVDVYGVSANAFINIPQLPETGFAPGVRTILPQQPENLVYQAIDDLRFAIPKQNLDLPIVGVPLTTDGWDLTWLSSQVGYLEGTAYPTWDGNTGLTAHVYNADGTPGPFVNLHLLRWGDKVEVTAFGQVFTYEVRSVERVSPNDLSVLRHEDRSWLTLITCQSFDETKGSYTWRVVVRAVLVSVEPIK